MDDGDMPSGFRKVGAIEAEPNRADVWIAPDVSRVKFGGSMDDSP
jgi:hypothetical protein